MATQKRAAKRKPRSIKQIAQRVIRTAEKKAEKLIHAVESPRQKGKPRVAKRTAKKPVRRGRATRARAH
jgi:hypothetical protein